MHIQKNKCGRAEVELIKIEIESTGKLIQIRNLIENSIIESSLPIRMLCRLPGETCRDFPPMQGMGSVMQCRHSLGSPVHAMAEGWVKHGYPADAQYGACAGGATFSYTREM